MTYCRGASNALTCGVDILDLKATADSKSVTVNSFPQYVNVSAKKNYLACYYHIAGDTLTWIDGTKIEVTLSLAYGVAAYIYGGTSR
jgi:hypothetical protein